MGSRDDAEFPGDGAGAGDSWLAAPELDEPGPAAEDVGDNPPEEATKNQ